MRQKNIILLLNHPLSPLPPHLTPAADYAQHRVRMRSLALSLIHHHFHGATDTKERCLDNARALPTKCPRPRPRPLSRIRIISRTMAWRVRLNLVSSNFLLSDESVFFFFRLSTPLRRAVDAVVWYHASISLLPFPGHKTSCARKSPPRPLPSFLHSSRE